MITLDSDDTATLIDGLTDAIDYRLDGGGDGCGDCTHDELCEDHRADGQRADRYQALLDKVRKEST